MSSHAFVSVRPNSGVVTLLYTVPANTRATLRVIASNTGSSPTPVRISVAPTGAADAISQYVVYNRSLPGNDGESTAPLMLPAGAIIRCFSISGEVNFHVTGLLQSA